jgi:FkbM family methyltransferase
MDTPRFPDDHYVVDVGMHDGKDSDYYAARGFRVIAFEANPALAEEGDARFTAAGLPVEVRNLAVSDSTESHASFYINRQRSQWSSIHPGLAARASEAVAVKVRTCNLADELRDVCDRIHMVKIDIEGADLLAVRQIAELSRMPDYISVENGSLEFLDLFARMGYTRFKYSNQKYVRFHAIPAASPHGRVVKYAFQDHSSGAFGEDLIGRWLTLEEATLVTRALSSGRSLAPNNLWAESIGWFDLHAGR